PPPTPLLPPPSPPTLFRSSTTTVSTVGTHLRLRIEPPSLSREPTAGPPRCLSGGSSVAVGAVLPTGDPLPTTADAPGCAATVPRSEEHTSELQSRSDLVCR